MKLIGISGGETLSGEHTLSLGFGRHPCELTTMTLYLKPHMPANDVAARLRHFADKIEKMNGDEDE